MFSPGKLTIEFNEGKRKKYINPIRLYLIASLFYFFAIAVVIPNDIVDRIISGNINKEFFDLNTTPEQQEIIRASLDSLEDKEFREGSPKLNTLNSTDRDSTSLLQIAVESREKAKETWRNLRLMAIDPEVNDTEFDSVIKATGFSSSLDIRQQRDFIANSNIFISGAIKNLPIMMFFLLPFFALMLWILYLKSNFFLHRAPDSWTSFTFLCLFHLWNWDSVDGKSWMELWVRRISLFYAGEYLSLFFNKENFRAGLDQDFNEIPNSRHFLSHALIRSNCP